MEPLTVTVRPFGESDDGKVFVSVDPVLPVVYFAHENGTVQVCSKDTLEPMNTWSVTGVHHLAHPAYAVRFTPEETEPHFVSAGQGVKKPELYLWKGGNALSSAAVMHFVDPVVGVEVTKFFNNAAFVATKRAIFYVNLLELSKTDIRTVEEQLGDIILIGSFKDAQALHLFAVTVKDTALHCLKLTFVDSLSTQFTEVTMNLENNISAAPISCSIIDSATKLAILYPHDVCIFTICEISSSTDAPITVEPSLVINLTSTSPDFTPSLCQWNAPVLVVVGEKKINPKNRKYALVTYDLRFGLELCDSQLGTIQPKSQLMQLVPIAHNKTCVVADSLVTVVTTHFQEKVTLSTLLELRRKKKRQPRKDVSVTYDLKRIATTRPSASPKKAILPLDVNFEELLEEPQSEGIPLSNFRPNSFVLQEEECNLRHQFHDVHSSLNFDDIPSIYPVGAPQISPFSNSADRTFFDYLRSSENPAAKISLRNIEKRKLELSDHLLAIIRQDSLSLPPQFVNNTIYNCVCGDTKVIQTQQWAPIHTLMCHGYIHDSSSPELISRILEQKFLEGVEDVLRYVRDISTGSIIDFLLLLLDTKNSPSITSYVRQRTKSDTISDSLARGVMCDLVLNADVDKLTLPHYLRKLPVGHLKWAIKHLGQLATEHSWGKNTKKLSKSLRLCRKFVSLPDLKKVATWGCAIVDAHLPSIVLSKEFVGMMKGLSYTVTGLCNFIHEAMEVSSLVKFICEKPTTTHQAQGSSGYRKKADFIGEITKPYTIQVLDWI
ncbi:hypothetical protein Pelo_709 [Pelomyxa schiedti]|nr:hypothetical protein Pelo_709 [Pelomyxa schiedti]